MEEKLKGEEKCRYYLQVEKKELDVWHLTKTQNEGEVIGMKVRRYDFWKRCVWFMVETQTDGRTEGGRKRGREKEMLEA